MVRRTPSAGWRPRHLPQLDGLRTIAMAFVLVYHVAKTEDLHLLPGGFVGVDLFFVLSGFLITSLLLREHADTGGVRLREFYVRRLWRLYPALVLVSAVTAVAFVFPNPFDLEPASPLESLVALTYGMSYWGGLELPGGPYLLGLTWSLSVEEHFYLLWPLALLLLLRRGWRAGAVVALAVLANAYTAALYYAGADINRLYYMPDARFAQILTGCALAALLQRPQGLGRLRAATGAVPAGLVVAGIAALLLLGTRYDGWYWGGGMQVVGVGAGILIGHLVLHERGRLATALGWRPLAVVGAWTYGIYLWHLPLIRLAQPVFGETLLVAVAAALLAVPVAAASYCFVEQPLLKRRSLRPAQLRAAPRPAPEPQRERELVRSAA
jgi:peptidoglycan/LPS O-acetylase OafA/YrhL